jgi:hypothetical protein
MERRASWEHGQLRPAVLKCPRSNPALYLSARRAQSVRTCRHQRRDRHAGRSWLSGEDNDLLVDQDLSPRRSRTASRTTTLSRSSFSSGRSGEAATAYGCSIEDRRTGKRIGWYLTEGRLALHTGGLTKLFVQPKWFFPHRPVLGGVKSGTSCLFFDHPRTRFC